MTENRRKAKKRPIILPIKAASSVKMNTEEIKRGEKEKKIKK